MDLKRAPIPRLEDIRHVHLIAVCGTGMGSLAGMLKERGLRVTGSDQNVYPPMSTQLEAQGIELRQGYRAENLSDGPDLVVVGNAVSRTNPEVEALLASGIPFASFPEALDAFFLENRTSIVAAGTHGKTTTVALMAWVLEASGLAPGFMIGGMARNFSHNGRAGNGKPFVAEGDEYDSAFFDKEPKFLHYRPNIGILTSVEYDHGDIYADFDILKAKFTKFVEMLPADGLLIACTDYEAVREMLSSSTARTATYGLTHEAQWTATNIQGNEKGGTQFSVVQNGKPFARFDLPMSGRHNVLNALAVIVAAHELGLSNEQIQHAFDGFLGIRRRQELVAEVNDIAVYDDFAHHPTAISETIRAVRMRHPDRRLIAVFEPRSNTSRRNVFQNEFPPAFVEADSAVIAPVFNAAKIPLSERLDVDKVVAAISEMGVQAVAPADTGGIVSWLASNARSGDVILIMSNGGFDGIHGRLATALGAVKTA